MSTNRDPFPPNEFHWSVYQEFRDAMRPILEEFLRDVEGTPMEEYRRIYIDSFFNLSMDRAYQFIYYVFAGSELYPSTRTYKDMLGPFRERIKRRYNEAGYEHTYFCWVKPNSIYLQAMRDELPLTPENFELASQTSLALYTEWLEAIAERLFTDLIPYAIDEFKPKSARYGGQFPFPGWRKNALKEAIENSGLMVRGIIPNPFAGHDTLGPYETDILPIQALRLVPQPPPPLSQSEIDYAEMDGNYPVPTSAIITHEDPYQVKSLPRTYYETLYRRLFNTLKYVDWRGLCRNLNLDPAVLRFIAVQDFGLNRARVQTMDLTALCQELYQVSEHRKTLIQQIAAEAAELAPAVIYQPGSVYVRPEKFVTSRKPPQYVSGFEKITRACQDPKTSKNLLVFLATTLGVRELLPEDLSTISQAKMCQILQRYVELLESTRRP